jgi:hypothetical protein
LPGEVWQRLKGILGRFEDAWRHGVRPALDDYVAHFGSERRALLIELVHEDLDFRMRAGETTRLEDYLERYPELRDEAAVLLDLLATEYLLRQGRGEVVNFKEYQDRFRGQAADLPRKVALRQAEDNGAAPTLLPPAGGLAPPAAVPSADGGSALPPTQPLTAPAVPAPAPTAEGVSVPGYEVLGRLGQGGMGVVYRARQLSLGRTVAVKMVRYAEHAGDDERRRFRAEAAAIAHL